MTVRRPRTPVAVGWREHVALPELCESPIKAKIDTGARTSSLHAFDLKIAGHDGVLMATFEIHPVQRSKRSAVKVSCPVTKFVKVRSSSGHVDTRPVVRTPIELAGYRYKIDITLTSRDEMGYRMLVGRSAIRRRFVVDAGKSFILGEPR